MEQPNTTEILFDRYCAAMGCRSEPIPRRVTPTADRMVQTPTGRVVVEIERVRQRLLPMPGQNEHPHDRNKSPSSAGKSVGRESLIRDRNSKAPSAVNASRSSIMLPASVNVLASHVP